MAKETTTGTSNEKAGVLVSSVYLMPWSESLACETRPWRS